MASFIKICACLSLLVVLSSCVDTGYAPSSGGDDFDGVPCDVIVEKNITGAEFVALLQDGSSASPFYVCIASNVSVNIAKDYFTVTKDYVFVQGASKTTSKLYTPFVLAQHFSVRKMNLIGDSAISTMVINPTSDIDLSIVNTNIDYGKIGLSVGGFNANVNLSKVTFNAVSNGVRWAIYLGPTGNLNGKIADTDIGFTTGSNGEVVSFSPMGDLSFDIENTAVRMNSTLSYSGVAYAITGSTGSVNSVGSGKSIACTVSGSAAILSAVYTTSGPGFSLANFQNTTNAGMPCP